MPAQRGADADAQVADAKLYGAFQLFLADGERLESRADMVMEQLSLRRQDDAPGTPGEQAAANALLELLDGFADGGLADIELPGGF